MTRNRCISDRMSFPLALLGMMVAFFLGFYGNSRLASRIMQKGDVVQSKRNIDEAPIQYHRTAIEQVSNDSIRQYLKST